MGLWALNSDSDMLNWEACHWWNETSHIPCPLANSIMDRIMPTHQLVRQIRWGREPLSSHDVHQVYKGFSTSPRPPESPGPTRLDGSCQTSPGPSPPSIWQPRLRLFTTTMLPSFLRHLPHAHQLSLLPATHTHTHTHAKWRSAVPNLLNKLAHSTFKILFFF